MEICACSFNEHLAELSTSPELEHPVFIRIMNAVCSRSRENGKELLQYSFFEFFQQMRSVQDLCLELCATDMEVEQMQAQPQERQTREEVFAGWRNRAR